MCDKVYVGYFNNRAVKNSELEKVSIARTTFGFKGKTATELLVPDYLFRAYMNQEINLDELKVRYRLNVLDILDPKVIFDRYKGKILLCHEVSGCHREELMLWLKKNNYECEEYRL